MELNSCGGCHIVDMIKSFILKIRGLGLNPSHEYKLECEGNLITKENEDIFKFFSIAVLFYNLINFLYVEEKNIK